MFLTGIELKQMKMDFERLLASPEATTVTLLYQSQASQVPIVVDRVYKREEITPDIDPFEQDFRCIHHVIDTESLKRYPGGLIRDGDSVFYFSTSSNLSEPVSGYPVYWASLYIKDSQGLRWKPRLLNGELPASFHHLFRVGQIQIAQAVACFLEK